jgi:acetyl-CoA carboxylase biotin carboxyl carrier protein
MADRCPTCPEVDLGDLSDHARRLAADLAGPLHRVIVRFGDASIEVQWQPRPAPAAATADLAPPPAGGPAAPMAEPADEGDGILMSSPMVGTFYRAPSPDAAPFVEIGDTVAQGQTVAMIEAMKLFNPITAEHPGIVAAVLAENGQAVEFGQALLRLTVSDLSEVSMSGKV